jgi:hypothetical protein
VADLSTFEEGSVELGRLFGLSIEPETRCNGIVMTAPLASPPVISAGATVAKLAKQITGPNLQFQILNLICMAKDAIAVHFSEGSFLKADELQHRNQTRENLALPIG